eukprot:4826292-Prymnesium_polylepis.1
MQVSLWRETTYVSENRDLADEPANADPPALLERKVPFCSLHCFSTAWRRSRSASVVACSATQDEGRGGQRTRRERVRARARAWCVRMRASAHLDIRH